MRFHRNNDDTPTRLALGAAAGIAGTLVMQLLRMANQKVSPSTLPPVQRDPGEFMTHQAKRLLPDRMSHAIPDKVEKLAGHSMHFLYGMSFGALYALFRGQTRSALSEGSLLGLITWATGYLGWLPVSGLMKPVWKHSPSQALLAPVTHALYGVATVAAYDGLKKLV
jgi:hypothetical protein